MLAQSEAPRASPLPALASGLEWRGEAGDWVTCSVSVVVGAVVSVFIGVGSRVAVSCSRADGGITTYVCIHEYVLYSPLYSVAAVILS